MWLSIKKVKAECAEEAVLVERQLRQERIKQNYSAIPPEESTRAVEPEMSSPDFHKKMHDLQDKMEEITQVKVRTLHGWGILCVAHKTQQ